MSGNSLYYCSESSQISIKDTSPKVVMTWIGRKINPKNVKKSLNELISAIEHLLPPGSLYSCCEQFDTYLRGGLYPALHISTDKKFINKLLLTNEFLPSFALGDEHMIEQAVYREIASVTPQGQNNGNASVFAVAGFRSIEEYVPEILVKEWKSWTGSRGLMLDIIQNGLCCVGVKFYIKEEPKDEPQSFFYVVTTEVEIGEPNDEGLFVDLLQRFRVERFLGYRTIYRYCKHTV